MVDRMSQEQYHDHLVMELYNKGVEMARQQFPAASNWLINRMVRNMLQAALCKAVASTSYAIDDIKR